MNKFNHVKPGDAFVPNAHLRNAIVDTLNRDPSTGGDNPGGLNIKANEVLVVNDCNSEIIILTPAVITGLGTNDLDVTNVFEHQVYKVQKATDETKDNPLVIVREYMDKKGSGETAPIEKAYYSGIVPVKVKVSDITHKFVDFDASGDFVSATSGKYQLAYPPAVIGDQLLKIILGGSASGDAYNGMFKVIQTADNKIKIVDGLYPDYAGDALINDTIFENIAVKEFTITANSFVYLIVTEGLWGNTEATIEIFTSKQAYELGKSKTLISRVIFEDSKIKDFSQEVHGMINGNMDGDCDA